jgi:DNA-binding LacI/PurR family transcriptional regulator
MGKQMRQKRIRLLDVAEAAGVSPGVVSQVLGRGRSNSRASEATRARILDVARSLNYRPDPSARRLRGARSNLYGVLVASAGDPLVSFLVQFLDVEAMKVGCHTLICNTVGDTALAPDQFDYHVRELAHQGMDGVFCAVHDWFGGDRSELVRQHPHTVFYEDPGIPGACHVTVDREAAGRLAVRHLFERGCRRIGIAVRGVALPKQAARLKGYRDEAAACGLRAEDALVFNGEAFSAAVPLCDARGEKWRFPSEIGARVVNALVRGAGADGIVAPDDFWASAIIRELRARGLRVPDDVAVVGYLNHYLADWVDPPLTTISRCPDEAARRMVAMMERLVRDGAIPARERSVVIRPKLVVRQSA